MSAVVDTSVLYAAFHRDDRHHARAQSDLAATGQWRVPLAVLLEFLDLVSYRFGPRQARLVRADLEGSGRLAIVQPQDWEATSRRWEADASLSLADAIGIQEAMQSSLPLLSYDVRQASAHQRMGGRLAGGGPQR